MSEEFESPSPDGFGTPREESRGGQDANYQTSYCLVVSQSPAKRQMLAHAANQAGWEVIVHEGTRAAVPSVQRRRFEMAWIDLQSAAQDVDALASGVSPRHDDEDQDDQDAPWKDLCQAIAGLPHVLLAICGREWDAEQEIWARQLGVWLYVPGLSVDDAVDVAELCEQARLVASGSHASYL